MSLSDKEIWADYETEDADIYGAVYPRNDVKGFVEELKQELRKGSSATPTAYDIIDKLAGERLVGETRNG